MKGLLIKEWYQVWSNPLTVLFPVGLFIVLGLMTRDHVMLMYIPLFLAMLPVSTTTMDETSHWQQYSVALPYSRRQLVTVKYLMTLIYAVAAAAIVSVPIYLKESQTVCTNISGQVLIGTDVGDILLMLVAPFAVGILTAAVVLPVQFKFGIARTRTILLVIIACFMGLVFLSVNNIINNGTEDKPGLLTRMWNSAANSISWLRQTHLLVPMLVLLLIAALAISWAISVKIVKKKEY